MAGTTEQHSGRVAVVTGAGRGIGHATAARLLRNGWRVGAFDIDTHGVADLKDIFDFRNSLVGHLRNMQHPINSRQNIHKRAKILNRYYLTFIDLPHFRLFH